VANTVVGVDIGSSSLRAVEVSDADKARPTVLRVYEAALPDGAVSRGEVLEANTVASVLKQVWSKGGFKSKNVVLGMGNQRVLSRDLTVPKMSLRRIRESLPFQVQDLLPVPVADALLDFYPVSESEGENGPVVHGLLIAAVKDAVLGNVKAVQLAGLSPVEVDLIPFALCRVLLTRPKVETTTALIDVGASTTTVVVATNGVPQFVRIIPSGSDDLTQALVTRLELTPQDAATTKISLGRATQVSSVEEQRAVEVIYEVTNELLVSLRNTVNYFANTRPQDPVRQVVLTGGGAATQGFAHALGEMVRIPVVMGDPFQSVALSRSLKADELRSSASAMTVALGLALGSNV
jgi:type IV pilus assembly protein PilM